VGNKHELGVFLCLGAFVGLSTDWYENQALGSGSKTLHLSIHRVRLEKGRRTRIKREVGLVFGSDCSWCILAFARTVSP